MVLFAPAEQRLRGRRRSTWARTQKQPYPVAQLPPVFSRRYLLASVLSDPTYDRPAAGICAGAYAASAATSAMAGLWSSANTLGYHPNGR